MRIGLDFDGTIASWAGAMDAWLQAHAGRPLDRDRNVVEQVDRGQLQAMIRAILGTDLTLAMEPEDEALAVMERLATHHELIVITARDEHEASFAARWLEGHGAPVRDVVSTGRALKADSCRALAVDVLLDDTAEHLAALAALSGDPIRPVLFRSRFGNPAPQPAAIDVVEHWLEFEAWCASASAAARRTEA
jgi:uncharacterized HAD superfamily protein